jgi:hypothetical protein
MVFEERVAEKSAGERREARRREAWGRAESVRARAGGNMYV